MLIYASCTTAHLVQYIQWDKDDYNFKSLSFAQKDMKDAYSIEPNLDSKPADYARKRLNLTESSFSQVGQDLTVMEILGNQKGGYFLDLAANHWKQLSNTLLLEVDYGFKGVCFEPNPQYHLELLRNRRCQLVTSPVAGLTNEIVKFRFDGVLGGIIHEDLDNKPGVSQSHAIDYTTGNLNGDAVEVELATVSLTAVLSFLQAPNTIDYLSLDVEGAEFLILQHHDFGMYHFKCITVERPSLHLHKLLTANKYRWLAQLGDFGDCTYIHESLPNFDELMSKYQHARSDRWQTLNGPPHEYMHKVFKFIVGTGELQEHRTP